jgi:hypothetical protein
LNFSEGFVILKSTKAEKTSWDVDSTSSKPFTLLEQLEPRILLSGDGLLAVAPDPLDSLYETMPQIVQSAELLERIEQAEERDPSDPSAKDIYPPIFTFSAGDENPEVTQSLVEYDEVFAQEVAVLDSQVETENSAVVVETAVDKFENDETVITVEDENLPCNNEENLST